MTTPSGAMTRGTLTLAALSAMAAMLPPAPPRIIVGMPTVGDNEVLELDEPRALLIGAMAYKKLLDHAKPFDRESDPFGLTFGIPIEQYGDRRDHFDIFTTLLSCKREVTDDAR